VLEDASSGRGLLLALGGSVMQWFVLCSLLVPFLLGVLFLLMCCQCPTSLVCMLASVDDDACWSSSPVLSLLMKYLCS
jgi:hypothetical protein